MPSTGRILLVDNDRDILKIVDRSLGDAGYAVMSTTDSSQARQILEDSREAIDLLLTDVFMPGASGPELARSALRSRSNLKVLFMSGDPKGRSHFRKEDQLIPKPFSVGELLKRVREVLETSDSGIARRDGVNEPSWSGTERRGRRSRSAAKS